MTRDKLLRVAVGVAAGYALLCIPALLVGILGVIWSTGHATFWLRWTLTIIMTGVVAGMTAHVIVEFVE